MIEKLSEFTGHEINEDEVHIFDVVLCDNDIDRDNEAFSDVALDTMQKLFISKTAIVNCNAKCNNQTVRIFDTQVVLDETRNTKTGEPYKYLKGNAYMVRTSSNENLIKEIESNIKKEVSMSCSAKTKRCSICGAEKYECKHIVGKHYDKKLCYIILDDITKVHEWSLMIGQLGIENKESYIDYYLSRDISKLATDCKQSLENLLSYLQNIDDSKFDEWDVWELKADKTRVREMIKEIHNNFGDDDYSGERNGK